jgi:hypothetical protein
LVIGRKEQRSFLDRGRFSVVSVTKIMVILAVVVLSAVGLVACSRDGVTSGSTGSSLTTGGSEQGSGGGGRVSGDLSGRVGEDIKVGEAVVTVRALQPTFQPADPVQRLSLETPAAPADGESFYQAFVRVLNKGVVPLRVDPRDFTLAIGARVVAVEPTRSGPAARSLLRGASLDLILTFKGEAGQEPILLYDPEWYEGTIRVTMKGVTTTTSR